MEIPQTRYAKSGNVHIAYQAVGEGSIDIVFVPWLWNHVEAIWNEPQAARILMRLASIGRLILLDQRGTGLSDPVALNELPTLETWQDDIRAVMDAVGSERAALIGHGDGGAISMMFAATHPERTSTLILWNAFARVFWAPDYPDGVDPMMFEKFTKLLAEDWGSGAAIGLLAPDRSDDAHFRERLGQLERVSASPGTVVAIQGLAGSIDVRAILPSIRTPTLVLQRENCAYTWIGLGTYLATHIAGASYKVVPGSDHLWWLDADPFIDEIEEFLTGTLRPPDPERVLATVLFTDIVTSTERATGLGDRKWRDLLDAHDMLVMRQVERFSGRLIKTTGDGALATFDGPARAVRCAIAIRDAVRGLGVEIRAGLHTGEIEARGEDISGLGVHIASRVATLAGAGEVVVSRTVTELVAGSGIEFEDRGEQLLKGVPGMWRVFAVMA